VSAAVKRLGLVLVLATGCVPPQIQMASSRMIEAQREVTVARDPEAKAYWQGVYDCHSKGGWPTSESQDRKGSDSEYRKCLDGNAGKQLAALRARAETQKTWSERAPTLRLVACIEQHDAKFTFAPFANLEQCAEKYPLKEDAAASAVRNDYAAAEAKGTPDELLAFLSKHPEDGRCPEVARRVVGASTAADVETQLSLDERIARAYPPVLTEIPAPRRILIVGPRGLRVRDLVKMRDAKIGDNVVLARIRASKEPYKSFDTDELAALKQLAIPDDVVTAMIEVTTKISESREAEQDRKALHSELEALKKLVAEKQAQGGGSGATVQTKDGPMDVAASCAKRLAAMKLCDQLPFPGSTICSSATESEFPCPVK
jgi:hypothetical protein